MDPEGRPTQEQILTLEELMLENLEWQTIDQRTELDGTVVKISSAEPAQIKTSRGVAELIAGTIEKSFDDAPIEVRTKFQIVLGTSLLSLELELTSSYGGFEAKTIMAKIDDGEASFDRGEGRILYKKIFSYLQQQANHRKRDITHLVQRTSDLGIKIKLSDKQWDKVFRPLLETAGYKELFEGTWTKTYDPQK